jgi:hypothetical protein
MNPIIGGPNKNPEYPTVVTIAKPTPEGRSFVFPAML